jgi:hypothetical protein
MKRVKTGLLVLTVAGALTAQAALADTLHYDGPKFSPYDGGFNIQDSSPAISWTGVAAGAFAMTDTSGSTLPAGTSFMAWCVDIYHHLSTSTAYTLQDGNTFYSAALYKDTDLERLASYVFDNSTTAFTNALWGAANVQSAAFQLATWEIVNDSAGFGSYNVNTGDFQVTSGDTNARNLANTWLAVVNTGTYTVDQQLGVWKQNVAGTTQDLAVFAPVPEPEIYAMMGVGLGLMGWIARRRKQQAA